MTCDRLGKPGESGDRNRAVKGFWSRLLAWIARGAKAAERSGQAPCRS